MSKAQRDTFRHLLVLGLPLVGGQLANASIQIVDTLMLGRYDSDVLAAVVVANSLFFSAYIVGSGFAWAVAPMISAAVAQGDTTRVRRVARMGLWISMVYAALSVPVFLSARGLLPGLGQSAHTTEIGAQYLDIAAWGMFPALAVMLFRSYLAAQERTRIVLYVTLAATALNAGLNWVLIYGNLGMPEMGARGAALASVSMHMASALALAGYAVRVFPQQQLFARIWRPDWDSCREVFRTGWPIGVATLAETGLFTASAIMVGWIGTTELAAHGIALQLASLAFMAHIGISHAGAVMMGTAMGSRDAQALRLVPMATMQASYAAAAISILIMVSMPRTLMELFLDPSDPAFDMIVQTGVSLVYLAALFQLADGAQVILIALLRGMFDTRRPMILATLGYWGIGATLALVLGPLGPFGAQGVWSGLVVALFCVAGLMSWRLWGQMIPRLTAQWAEEATAR